MRDKTAKSSVKAKKLQFRPIAVVFGSNFTYFIQFKKIYISKMVLNQFFKNILKLILTFNPHLYYLVLHNFYLHLIINLYFKNKLIWS